MICQKCKKAVATNHLTEIEQGKKREIHLCDACAQKEGMIAPFSIGQMLSDMSGVTEQDLASPEGSGAENVHCEQCGISYREFRTAGRLGCPHDYDAFREGLVPLLERLHGATQHVGKVPSQMGASMAREKELIELRRELQSVIHREDYERAAELRDRIRELEDETGTETEDDHGD
jgi:protein arginine kinase activator